MKRVIGMIARRRRPRTTAWDKGSPKKHRPGWGGAGPAKPALPKGPGEGKPKLKPKPKEKPKK